MQSGQTEEGRRHGPEIQAALVAIHRLLGQLLNVVSCCDTSLMEALNKNERCNADIEEQAQRTLP